MSGCGQVLGVLLLFWSLRAHEIVACEAGHLSGYLVVPPPSRGLLEPYYFVCCQLDRKPCVMILPRVRDMQTVICSVPEPGAFRSLTQIAAEAGVAIGQLNPQFSLLSGSVAAERAEEVAKLISRKASFLCATHRGVIHDVQ